MMNLAIIARKVAGYLEKAEISNELKPLEKQLEEAREELIRLTGEFEKVQTKIRTLHFLRPKMCEKVWLQQMEQLVAASKWIQKCIRDLELDTRGIENKIERRDAQIELDKVISGFIESV